MSEQMKEVFRQMATALSDSQNRGADPYGDAIRNIFRVAHRGGYVLVPITPTPEMINAACEADYKANENAIHSPDASAEEHWGAMIAARPPVPSKARDGGEGA
jgi:hypothetical protein